MKMVEILLVEDNPGDVELAREALHTNMIRNNLHVTEDGEQALDFLYQRGAYTQAPKPDLILLDLNLPKKDGREVLAVIKEDMKLRAIPVVILTSSQADEDILQSYNLHANCYITKPLDFEQFLKVVENIKNFWLGIVALPSE